jgi:hypothetical protein
VLLLQLIDTISWAALSTWFGGALFLAVASGVIFRVHRDADPTLPRVLSVNIDGDHASLLSAEVVSGIDRLYTLIGLVCAAVIVVAIVVRSVAQPDGSASSLVQGLIVLLASIVTAYQGRSLRPRIERARLDYINHADDPEKCADARSRFNRFSREYLNVLMMLIALLLAAILFSAVRQPGAIILAE